MSKPADKRPMTSDEIEAAKCLAQPTYPVGSFDKRFAGLVVGMTVGLLVRPAPQITDKEAQQLWRIFYRYRRQISHPDKARLLKLAEERMAPQFNSRKYQDAQAAQRRIDGMKLAAAMEAMV